MKRLLPSFLALLGLLLLAQIGALAQPIPSALSSQALERGTIKSQSAGTVFALGRSLYPAGAYVGGLVPTNQAADFSLGSMHHTSFSMLGRHPGRGWFQGAVWQPSVEATRPDGFHRRYTALLMTAYLVSDYDSASEAQAALRDLFIAGWSDPGATPRQTAIQLGTTGWHRLDDGVDGRMYAQTKDGYTVIVAGFSVGSYDVEDVTLIAPHTPRAYERTMRLSVLRQLKALDRIAAALE
jgi:hypothetical protein